MSTPGRECHVEEELGAYILGGLAPAEAARVRAHLGVCGHCRSEYDRLAVVTDWLDELPATDELRLPSLPEREDPRPPSTGEHSLNSRPRFS
jgi:anti-sigma factor RsiW